MTFVPGSAHSALCLFLSNLFIFILSVAFKMYDLDGDDKISRDELLNVLHMMVGANISDEQVCLMSIRLFVFVRYRIYKKYNACVFSSYCRTGIFRKRAIFGIWLIGIFRKV